LIMSQFNNLIEVHLNEGKSFRTFFGVFFFIQVILKSLFWTQSTIKKNFF
jgi:hypothetical protein